MPHDVATRRRERLIVRILRHRTARLGGLIVLIFILAAVFATPLSALSGNDPYTQHTDLLGPSSAPLGFGGGISAEHWFGVTPLGGRDLFAIVVHGAQISLGIGLASTAVSVVIGVTIGLLAGYFPGVADRLLSRFTDVIFGFPFLIFAIALAAVVPPSVPKAFFLVLVLGFFGWPTIARLVRAETASLTNRGFVVASRSMGHRTGHVLVRQILPNIRPLLVVYITLAIPGRIGAEAALSYLGVGINPPTASWGRSISDAVSWIQVDPAYLLFPGGALVLLTLGFNLLGDGLRDVLDPRQVIVR